MLLLLLIPSIIAPETLLFNPPIYFEYESSLAVKIPTYKPYQLNLNHTEFAYQISSNSTQVKIENNSYYIANSFSLKFDSKSKISDFVFDLPQNALYVVTNNMRLDRVTF